MIKINGVEYTDKEFTKKVALILTETYETILILAVKSSLLVAKVDTA